MGGTFLPKLNIYSRPIVNKYREGKVKRTLKRELKLPEIVKGKADVRFRSILRSHMTEMIFSCSCVYF